MKVEVRTKGVGRDAFHNGAFEVWCNGKLHSLHSSHRKAWRKADELAGEAVSAKEAAHEWSSRQNDR